MAHEAFALSPISARATQPSEEDYDAISAAFMETARGRWFLGEFAKRNRSVDTRLVLEAVARIEQTLVAQNEPDTGRAEALTAIKAALDKARAAASLALDSLALEGNLTPVRKGTRIIKEISWRWREIGADGRICDLIDSQLSAIEASCDQISSVDPRGTLSAAFDLIDETLAVFDEVDHAAAEAGGDAVSSPSSNPWAPPQGEMPAATTQRGPAAAGKAETGAVAGAPATPVEPAAATVEAAIGTIVEEATAEQPIAEAIDAVAIAADATANTEAHVTEASVTEANTSSDAADMTAEAADAHDDAVLDLIAAEMAAPDPSDEDDDVGNLAGVSPPAAREPIAVTSEAPAASVIAPAIQPSLSPSPQPSFAKAFSEASGEVSDQISLGSTLVANGIVRKPATSAPDPLAAIRRLSQAEKIALFS